MKSRFFAALAAGPVLVTAAWLVLPAGSAAAAACGSGGTTWQTGTETGGVQVLDNANNWGGGNACLRIGANGVDWTLLSQTVNGTGLPVAFPDTNLGCEGGACTLTAGQREPLGTATWGAMTPKVTGTFSGTDTAAGHKNNDLIDSEFSADCTGGASPVMDHAVSIYLDAVSSGVHGSYTALGLADANSGPTFTDAGGKVWYTKQVTNGSGVKNTEFSAVTPISSVTNRTLHQFFQWASTHGTGYLPSTVCLRDIGMGNETWTAITASTLKLSGVNIDP